MMEDKDVSGGSIGAGIVGTVGVAAALDPPRLGFRIEGDA